MAAKTGRVENDLSDAKRVQFKIDFWSSESQNDGMKAVVTSFFAGTKTTLVERVEKEGNKDHQTMS